MKTSSKIFILTLFIVFSLAAALAQNTDPDGAAAKLSTSTPGYADAAPATINLSPTQAGPITSATVLQFPANARSSRAVFSAASISRGSSAKANSSSGAAGSNRPHDNFGGDDGQRPNKSTIDGMDSLATFAGSYINQAGPDFANRFYFTMIGNHPALGGTTEIPAQITTVNLVLLNPNGSVNVNVPFVFRDLIEDSPNFARTTYRSGRNIQFADAIHRAQFFHVMGDDWHTVLKQRYVNNVTMTIPRFVNVQFADGSIKAVQAYRVGTASDGNHFVLMLDLLFNFLYDNQVINDINGGNFTTNALSMTLFPNTFLYSIDNSGQLSDCCVLGFHTYFWDPSSIPQPRWVTQYASWISPGLFGGGFQDVTALSHETSEAFADPFVDNATANWQFPGVPATAKFCQANLEEGDPIEVLPTVSTPMTLRERKEVFTYHPQVIPLLQWFEMGATSNAIDGAFSFPDETTLPHSALPCPQ